MERTKKRRIKKSSYNMKKLISDYKCYLDEIEKLSKGLNKEQRVKLQNILSGQLTLLICLKQNSGLGRFTINFKE